MTKHIKAIELKCKAKCMHYSVSRFCHDLLIIRMYIHVVQLYRFGLRLFRYIWYGSKIL